MHDVALVAALTRPQTGMGIQKILNEVAKLQIRTASLSAIFREGWAGHGICAVRQG